MLRRRESSASGAVHIAEEAITIRRPLRAVALVEATAVNGAVKPLLTFADTLRAQKMAGSVELSLFAFRRSPDLGENALSKAAAAIGLPVTPICERRVLDTSILDQLREQLSVAQPDVVLSLATKSHFLVRLLGLHKKYSWMACHHGYTHIDAKNVAYNQLDRWSLRSATVVMTVCRAFVPELLQAGVKPDRIRILHNPVAPFVRPPEDEIRKIRAACGIGAGERVVFVAGRLSKEKGHIDLIDALGVIQRKHSTPPFRTIIAGDGPERPALEQRAREAGVSESVVFTGFQPNLAPFYALSDLFVLPSHSEGSPNVLLEALAAGVPVVATRAGGVPEILQGRHATTMLVDTQSPDDLAARVAKVLEDDSLRLELRQTARELSRGFTPSLYAHEFLRMLGEACGRPVSATAQFTAAAR